MNLLNVLPAMPVMRTKKGKYMYYITEENYFDHNETHKFRTIKKAAERAKEVYNNNGQVVIHRFYYSDKFSHEAKLCFWSLVGMIICPFALMFINWFVSLF